MVQEKSKNQFWIGLFVGAIISIATSLLNTWYQHSINIEEKKVQLYLDEKKEFVIACDAYLKEYRQWHEIMNYLVYKDSSRYKSISEFQNFENVSEVYREWKKDFDFAYGKIFLLSDNEFGFKTMEVSTVLHGLIEDLLTNTYDYNKRQSILQEGDNYFFKEWLITAQEEIFRYNSGTRLQKSMKEFAEEQKQLIAKGKANDSVDDRLYDGLLRAYNYMRIQDSIQGKKTRGRMPTKEEFKELVNPSDSTY